jgi:hypothetical protein
MAVPGTAYVVDRLTHPRSRVAYHRAQVLDWLESRPGNHVVIVRYLPGHIVDAEWVYNSADIDAQRVIWARDMGVAKNRELIDHYADRTAWIIAEDGLSYLVDRYPGPEALWQGPAAFEEGWRTAPAYSLTTGPPSLRPSAQGLGPVNLGKVVDPPPIWQARSPLR